MEADKFLQNGYSLALALNHKDLIAFISDYLFRKNVITRGFLLLILILLLLLAFAVTVFILSEHGTIGLALQYFGIGFALSFFLVVPHELLHGIAYKICGAPSVSYRANWRKLYFMAIADKFLTYRGSFFFIALLPISLITMLLILAAFFITPNQQIMWLTTAFFHALMCAGDIGLLSFYAENDKAEILTYDDIVSETSYFYIKNKNT